MGTPEVWILEMEKALSEVGQCHAETTTYLIICKYKAKVALLLDMLRDVKTLGHMQRRAILTDMIYEHRE